MQESKVQSINGLTIVDLESRIKNIILKIHKSFELKLSLSMTRFKSNFTDSTAEFNKTSE